MTHEHVRIAVTDTVTPGVEHVPARKVGDNEWQLIRSPLYAKDVARGDVIRVLDRDTGAFEIAERAGNICVQFYLSEHDADDAEKTEMVAKAIASDLASIRGQVDGQTRGLIAFSIPVEAGFPSIERVFEAARLQYPGAQWQFSNVYDSETGQPLAWWKDST